MLGQKRELSAWVPQEMRERLKWTPEIRGEAHGTSWAKCLVLRGRRRSRNGLSYFCVVVGPCSHLDDHGFTNESMGVVICIMESSFMLL